MVDLKQNIY